MSYHVSIIKRLNKPVEYEVWGDEIGISVPLDSFLAALIEESGQDGHRIRRAADEITGEMKRESIKFVR